MKRIAFAALAAAAVATLAAAAAGAVALARMAREIDDAEHTYPFADAKQRAVYEHFRPQPEPPTPAEAIVADWVAMSGVPMSPLVRRDLVARVAAVKPKRAEPWTR